MTKEDVQKLKEYVELRMYLQSQIKKIKDIISLRKLQILCRLKMMIKKIVGYLHPALPPYNYPIDFQIKFYQECLSELL